MEFLADSLEFGSLVGGGLRHTFVNGGNELDSFFFQLCEALTNFFELCVDF